MHGFPLFNGHGSYLIIHEIISLRSDIPQSFCALLYISIM